MFEEVRSNVVITAQTFNPSIVSELWLLRKGIIEEGGLEAGSVFANEVSQAITKNFNLLVVEPQLQFTPKVPENDWGRQAQETITKFVKALPETPYTGIGINFTVALVPERESVTQLERRLFFRSELPFSQEFKTDDCRYGGYFSKDLFDGRLRMEMRPATATVGEDKENRLLFQFNFHRDAVEGTGTLLEHLAKWDEAKEVARRIVNSVKS